MFNSNKNSAAVADTLIKVGGAAAVAPSTTFKYVKYAAAAALGGSFMSLCYFVIAGDETEVKFVQAFRELIYMMPFTILEKKKTRLRPRVRSPIVEYMYVLD